jgi:beta-lactamase class A
VTLTAGAASVGAVSTTTVPNTTTTMAHDPYDPFAPGPIQRFLDSRSGRVTAGVIDLITGREYLYHDHVQMITASMAKMDILAALLNKSQRTGVALTVQEKALIRVMIEDSDNAAAQLLWNDLGGFGLISRVTGTGGTYVMRAWNARVGFSDTFTDWGWSEQHTVPADYLRLLKVIVEPNALLDPASQSYEKSLMEHVISSQRFGVPHGVPAGVEVGNKNGWYPESVTGWQVNSAGYVLGTHTRYLAVIMAGYNPDESYGMDTVSTFGSMLWRQMSAGRGR